MVAMTMVLGVLGATESETPSGRGAVCPLIRGCRCVFSPTADAGSAPATRLTGALAGEGALATHCHWSRELAPCPALTAA